MAITPVELKNYQFARKLRGYERADVDTIIEEAAGEMERLISENTRLQGEVKALEERLITYQNIEQSLKQAMVTAEEAVRQQQEAMVREAEVKLKEAELECEQLKALYDEEIEKTKKELFDLRQQRIGFLAEMRSVVEAHLRLIDGQATDSSDETARTQESPSTDEHNEYEASRQD